MKKGKLVMICLLIITLISGCGKATVSKNNQSDSTKQDENIEANNKEDQNQAEQTKESDNKQGGDSQQTSEVQDDSTQTGVAIKVYYSSSDASGFEDEEVSIESLSSKEVLKALAEKGVLPVDVSLLSFKEFEKDGEKVLDIDFSEEFNTYIKTLGSSSEYYIVGSICNTFLDAYACDKAHITVDGEIFTTGHAEYPGYMGKFN